MEGSGEHTPFTSLDDIPLDLNRGATMVTLMKDRPENKSPVRLTSSVVQSPRGSVNQADIRLLPSFPLQRIGRFLHKPVPVPQHPLRRSLSPAYISQQRKNVEKEETNSDRGEKSACRTEGIFCWLQGCIISREFQSVDCDT